MILTDEERNKFIAYLEMNASTSAEMIKQFEKLSGPAMIEMAKREKQKLVAYTIIANDLKSAESMTI